VERVTDFLLELRSEEIPARMQAKARADLERLFAEQMAAAGLKAASITVYSTPRRLALIASGLPLETQAVSEETKGPKTSAPPQALEGFLRKTGLTQDQLVDRDGVYFAVIEKAGRSAVEVLSMAIFGVIAQFPWPKSMRWGHESTSTASLKWVRPLQGIVALFGDDVVPFELVSHAEIYENSKGDIDIVKVSKGLVSGRETMGHRFHHHGPVTIGNAGDYETKLRACHVIVDHEERQNIIRDGAAKAAADAGLRLIEDEGLVIENAGLTEWPVPLLGRFDESFLAVPPEVIQLTARVNQKYFVCQDGAGKLANAFVCTANISAHDGGAAIAAGNEKVLAARLGDAKFFWEQDLKVPLDVQREKLSSIVFHEKLGTVADKVERVAKLARWLVEEGIVAPLPPAGGAGGGLSPSLIQSSPAAHPTPNPSREREGDIAALAAQAERAARLCKADLVTGMVGEFPELQGIMGGYYARAQGEDDAVADAIRDHYKPVGQGDDVPTAPLTVAVSLADKLDTLCQFFLIDEAPTGSKDPYALRRASLSIISLILNNDLRFRLHDVLLKAVEDDLAKFEVVWHGHLETKLAAFFADRLKVQQREAGVRHDLIDAVFALGGEDDLVRLLARVKALQAFVATDEGTNLLAGYKRAANILKADPSGKNERHPELVSGSIVPSIPSGETAEWMLKQVQHDGVSEIEIRLFNALNDGEAKAIEAIEAEDFSGAMIGLAVLRSPIDAFLDKETGVMVNDPDPDKRAFRIGLLTRFRDAVHTVADFSKIEG
jgi:glycyl-tRNA synthetase beta chain